LKHLPEDPLFKLVSLEPLSNGMVFLEVNNLKCRIPLQVSKLYEVVPPILTELGKVYYATGLVMISASIVFILL
jgi:hypothetical protein